MDESMEELTKRGAKGTTTSTWTFKEAIVAIVIGHMGNLFTKQYLHKDKYKEASESGI